ncbi:MAG: hypothetical protein KDI30_07305, partial [Pseudomonadales bacterium]|nr:hypothetical protein [Pseudomonadales bacterium]
SQHHMRRVIGRYKPEITLEYIGRKSSAAPAAGYMSLHLAEQKRFINQAMKIK